MLPFIHHSHAARVLFGAGRIEQLSAELERLGVTRVLFVCTPGGRRRYSAAIESIGARCIGVFDRAEPHCPQSVAEEALRQSRRGEADAVVAIGGGSTIGIGKYIAAKSEAKVIVAPTTPSGSEMTSLFGVKIGAEKRTARDDRVRPSTIIYDPLLTLTLPAHETATIGMNCLAHCVEALYSQEPDPIARLLAREGIRALFRALPLCCAQPDDVEAREQMLYAGMLGGLVVSMVGIGLHHKICHVLGGQFGVPHGESNAVILPYVVAYNTQAAPEAMNVLREITVSLNPAEAIYELARRIRAPRTLRELGMPEDALEACARELTSAPIYNPRQVTFEEMLHLLQVAHAGLAPITSILPSV